MPADRAIFCSQLEVRGLDPQRELFVLESEENGWLDEAKFENAMAKPNLQMAVVRPDNFSTWSESVAQRVRTASSSARSLAFLRPAAARAR
ncbi:MAG: hypothetical protein ABI233_04970 [Chthoniobacterales bacterium]